MADSQYKELTDTEFNALLAQELNHPDAPFKVGARVYSTVNNLAPTPYVVAKCHRTCCWVGWFNPDIMRGGKRGIWVLYKGVKYGIMRPEILTVADVRTAVEDIRSSVKDDERCHGLEDALWKKVLEAIAAGSHQSKELAEEALKTTKIEFSRWSA